MDIIEQIRAFGSYRYFAAQDAQSRTKSSNWAIRAEALKEGFHANVLLSDILPQIIAFGDNRWASGKYGALAGMTGNSHYADMSDELGKMSVAVLSDITDKLSK